MKNSESIAEKMFPSSKVPATATPAPKPKVEAREPIEGWCDETDPNDRRPKKVMIHPPTSPEGVKRAFTAKKSLLQVTRRGPAADAMNNYIGKSALPLAEAEGKAEELLAAVSTDLEDGRFMLGERSALASLIFSYETTPPDIAQQEKWRSETRRFAKQSYGEDAGRRLEAVRAFVTSHPSLNRVESHPDFARHLLQRADDLR